MNELISNVFDANYHQSNTNNDINNNNIPIEQEFQQELHHGG
jgi:hypothetical protein